MTAPDLSRVLRPAACTDCSGDLTHYCSHGRCRRCYDTWVKAGRPEPPPRVPLPAGAYGYSQAWGTARGGL